MILPHYLESSAINADQILDQIRRLVEIESPTYDADGVNRALDEVIRQFDGTGAKIERIATPKSFGDIVRVKCHPGRSGPGLLVLSHVDTVHPIGTLGGPLPYRRDGDKVYGPGIYDMKGGLAIAIAAWRRIAQSGLKTGLPVTFLFTPDEEIGSPASRQFIEEEALSSSYVLVTEPARDGGKIVTARKGVGRFVINARGVPAHAGTNHEKGHSAIKAIAELVTRIERFTDYMRGVTTNVGLISGGTGVNVIPETCQIEVDLRVCDVLSAEEMVARIHDLKASDPEVEITVTGGMNRPPFSRNPKIEALFDQAAGIARKIGFKLETVELAGGGSDGNFTVDKGIPTLDGLGVDGAGAHTNHEYILYSSIVERSQLMQGLMEELA